MRSALFILSAFLISSCSLVNDSDSNNHKPLIPLDVGNSWVMNIDLGSNVSQGTVSVTQDSLIGNNTWFKLESENRILQEHFEGFYTNEKDGFYRYTGSETVSDNVLLFKRTKEAGETYVNDTGRTKWITTYDGENNEISSAILSKTYIVEYEYISNGDRTYTIDQPYQFRRVISSETGFVEWESAYLRALNDSVLTLSENGRINLSTLEFIQVN